MDGLTVFTARSPRPACGYWVTPDAAFIFLPSGGFVIDMRADAYALDPASADSLRVSLETGIEAAAAERSARVGIPVRDAHAQITEFLASLREQGLLDRAATTMRLVETRPIARLLAAAAIRLCRPGNGGSRRLRLAIALARLSFRRYGWTRTIDAWKAALPNARPGAGSCSLDDIDTAISAASTRGGTGADCKERALCAWSIARLEGHEAALIIGLQFHPLAGHCWCLAGGRPLGDRGSRIARFAPVLRYS